MPGHARINASLRAHARRLVAPTLGRVPLAFDTTGLQRHDERTWFDPRTGDQVSLTYFDLEPDLPASLEELPLLRQRLAHVLAEAGTLVEAHVVTIDSVPALYQVVKLPIPGRQTGLMFVAALTVPKATGSVVLQVLCQEGNTSGIRESMVSAQIGFENCFPPHPYAPGLQGMLPWNVADDQRWDNQFPEHPLSRARAWAHRTIQTTRVDPNFARLPAFRPQEAPPNGSPFGSAADAQHPTPDAFTAPEPQEFGTLAEPPTFGGSPRRFTAPATPEPQAFGAGPTDAQSFTPPIGDPIDAQRFTPPGNLPDPATQDPFGAPPEPQTFGAPETFGAPPEPQPFGSPSDSQRFPPQDAFGTPPEPPNFGNPTDSQHFAAPAPEPQTFGSPTDSHHFPEPDTFGTPPEPQTFGGSTNSQRFAASDTSDTPPEPQTFGGPADSQHFPEPDTFGTPPEPQTFGGPTDSQRFAAPDTTGTPPKTFGTPTNSQHLPEPDTFGTPPEPQNFGNPTDSQHSPAQDAFGGPPQTFGSPPDSQRFPEPDTFGTPPEPQTVGDPQHFPAPDAFGAPPEPQTFGDPTDSQRFAPPATFGTPPEPQTFSSPTDSQRFAAPDPSEPPTFGNPTDSQHFAAPVPEPQAFTAPPADAPVEPRKPRPFPAPKAFEPPAEEPRKFRPSPVPRTPRAPLTFEPPEIAEPEPFDVNSAFTAPEPEPVAPVAAGDVLHTVLVGVPIGDYLPLWQREGQEDTVTFWRMSDPDAVRARLGTGVESRSAVDTGRYREAAMFSPERQMLFLMDRFRDDSGTLGGTSEQLFPATEEEAYQAADDKALSGLYSWLGEVMLAAVRRGEFVAVESGGWDVPVNPVVLVMLRNDGRNWHSVVETSPVPVGAPVWRDQQPVEGSSQILASPATDQTLRASGLLTRFAINTWSMHPFQLGISFGPNPTLEDQ